MFNFGKCYKYLDRCSNGFYNIKTALTYGRPFIFVTGTRSVGKSTNVAALCIINYIVNGKKFFYVRRRPEDIQQTYKTFFNNAISIVNEYCGFSKKVLGIKAYNGKYYISFEKTDDDDLVWEEFGSYIPLVKEENLKSSVFSEYTIILYDEFISKDPNKYLGCKSNIEAEWDALISLYQTVDRGVGRPYRNETVMICLANKATMFNPVCLTVGISDYVIPGYARHRITAPKKKQWLWEDVGAVDATVDYKDSYAYQMSTDNVRKYAYENEEIESMEFIQRPNVAYYDRTVKLKGQEYGIYHDKDFTFYIDKPKPGYAVLSLDTESHNHVSYLIMKWEEDLTLQALSMAYKRGKCYFGNIKIQRVFLQYLEFIK